MLGALMSLHPIRSTQHGRIGWFVLVGCGAAAVHWAVVVALVGQLGVAPLLANVGGWMVAFVFSFSGHHWFTFRGHGRSPWQAVGRFALVSALGFSINEAVYALMLSLTGQRYDLVLAGVLVAVAGLTYVLGRRWAFLRAE
jgi:putative flippase GtrA